ncbi:Fur family transcriptional regulator [Salirhabdus salicampi]|uniref:Fur family transcriptional regulator n=1 Tax=Salirhabdus salicampi TaxID=476102 RepID=UPI0020C593A3|nr:Fur family transcriptional regulator [Salirhabdus salicampi]MCP8617714.1 transcriptional repressor [Salirhabdus salicampi]
MNLQEALYKLKAEGYKLTDKRRDILQYFVNRDEYSTANEVLSHLLTLYKGVSYDTVYRNLYLFHQLRLLEQTTLNGEKHFRLQCETKHHHHLICKSCGKTKAIDNCPMEDVKKSLTGYVIEDHKFEIYGYCPDCKSA